MPVPIIHEQCTGIAPAATRKREDEGENWTCYHLLFVFIQLGNLECRRPGDHPQLARGPALVLHSSSPTRRSAEEGAAPWSRPLSSQSVSILSPAGRSSALGLVRRPRCGSHRPRRHRARRRRARDARLGAPLRWLLVIGGIMHSVHAFRVHPWGGFTRHLLGGVLSLVVGLLIVANPAAGALSLTLLLAAFFMVGGIFRIVAAVSFRFPGRRLGHPRRPRDAHPGDHDLERVARIWRLGHRDLRRHRPDLRRLVPGDDRDSARSYRAERRVQRGRRGEHPPPISSAPSSPNETLRMTRRGPALSSPSRRGRSSCLSHRRRGR